jgi:hypothetical protein
MILSLKNQAIESLKHRPDSAKVDPSIVNNKSIPLVNRKLLIRRLLAITIVLAIWLAARLIFWIGFAGSDDGFYARYAYLMHREPINQWEFRALSVWIMRVVFLALGPSEFSATLPSLLSSATMLGAIAWYVGWPNKSLEWTAQGSMLLAALLPLDVVMASYPGASSISIGFLAWGVVLMLDDKRNTSLVGAVLLSLAFVAHEFCFYYIAIFCLIELAVDWRKYRKPVALCVLLSAGYLIAECATYAMVYGRPFMRFQAMGGIAHEDRIQIEAQGSAALFFLMPLRLLVFNKGFGMGFVALFAVGALCWNRLERTQRVLLSSAVVYWIWMGYGPMVPWEYKPPSREIRLYFPLAIALCSLLPSALDRTFASGRLAQAIVILLMAIQLVCLTGGGRWGQHFRVSQQLLSYARARQEEWFLTDVRTWNEFTS